MFVLILPTYAAGSTSRFRTADRAFDTARTLHRTDRAIHASEASVQWAKIAKVPDTLPDQEIARLSGISKLHGSSRVGQELKHLRLSSSLREDTYLRIAVHRRVIGRAEALEMHRRLNGVDGFPATISKAISIREAQRIGYLNELRIATTASRRGFKPLAIGLRYDDGIKKALTDVDILLSRNGKVFAMEVKDYTSPMSLSTFRADLDSLVQYKRLHDKAAIPIFTVVNKPDNVDLLRTMQREAKSRNIELLFGSPTEQINKLKVLSPIL